MFNFSLEWKYGMTGTKEGERIYKESCIRVKFGPSFTITSICSKSAAGRP